MLRSFWTILLLLAVGVIFVLLPDNGNPLIKFNQYHGPSVMDTVGLVIIILVWIWMLYRVFFNWKKVKSALKIKGILIALLLVITGTVIIAATLALNMRHGWIPGAILAIAGYTIPVTAAIKKTE
jgi:hypothetical protein